jgi:hypothetical protein
MIHKESQKCNDEIESTRDSHQFHVPDIRSCRIKSSAVFDEGVKDVGFRGYFLNEVSSKALERP